MSQQTGTYKGWYGGMGISWSAMRKRAQRTWALIPFSSLHHVLWAMQGGTNLHVLRMAEQGLRIQRSYSLAFHDPQLSVHLC